MEDKLLTIAEVAERLQVHENTVYKMLRAGELEGVRVGMGKLWRVRRSALEAHLNIIPEEKLK